MKWLPTTGLIFLLAGLPLLFIAFGVLLARAGARVRARPRAFAGFGIVMGAIWLIQSVLLFLDGATPFRAWGNLVQGVMWLGLGLAVWLRPDFWTGRGAGQGAES